MRIRLGVASVVVFILLWMLWLAPALNRGGRVLIPTTRDFVKDLAPVIAVVVAGFVLTRRARETLQVRSALLPVIYDQARRSWMPTILRASKLADYCDAANEPEAAERALHSLLLVLVPLEEAARTFGVVHMSTYEGEDVIAAAEQYFFVWSAAIFGRGEREEMVDTLLDDHSLRRYYAYSRSTARKQPVFAASLNRFSSLFNSGAPGIQELMHIARIYAVAVDHEVNRIVQLWYEKSQPPIRDPLKTAIAALGELRRAGVLSAGALLVLDAAERYKRLLAPTRRRLTPLTS
jgi:hypothetical protein